MKVVILAGGLGTRLGDLARDRPKPMIEVAGKPFLEHVVDSFTARGFEDFVMLVGYRADVIEAHFGDGKSRGIRIEYRRESKPLGTGGAVRHARHLLGGRFILTYADVLRRFDYDRFAQRHKGNCLAVYKKIDTGNTEIEGKMVVRFDKNAPDLPYIDAGFAVLGLEVVDLLPLEPCSFEQIVYGTLASKRLLACEVVNHDFYDIGTPKELERTRSRLEKH